MLHHHDHAVKHAEETRFSMDVKLYIFYSKRRAFICYLNQSYLYVYWYCCIQVDIIPGQNFKNHFIFSVGDNYTLWLTFVHKMENKILSRHTPTMFFTQKW